MAMDNTRPSSYVGIYIKDTFNLPSIRSVEADIVWDFVVEHEGWLYCFDLEDVITRITRQKCGDLTMSGDKL